MTDKHYIPKKVRYYIISIGESYSSTDLFHFKDLDGAIEMFKSLQSGKAVSVEDKTVKTFLEKPDKDGDNYTYKTYCYEDTKKGEFHLTSKIVDVFTEEQIKTIDEIEAEKLKEAETKKSKAKKKGAK